MKKLILIFLICILNFSQNIIAQTKKSSPAIEMVSYEQSWIDSKGTISLKNNTSEDINNITFIIEYLDMQGNPMDYETFSYIIDIAPAMTKKLDIPAYEHERRYHYYKTKDDFGNPAFNIRYELKDYNTPTVSQNNAPTSSKSFQNVPLLNGEFSSKMMITIILILLLTLSIYLGLYVLVAVMSMQRNRNPAVWLLLSFVSTPILICLILLIIGDKSKSGY